MNYCKRCLIPSTKPHINFDLDGVCNACLSHDKKKKGKSSIDWKKRGYEFSELLKSVSKKRSKHYDVLVPVSGGKDSISQVAKILEADMNLRVLAVSVDYGIKTKIGRSNLDLIPEMGCTLLTYRPNLQIHKNLVRIGFEKYGDPDLFSHALLHAIPLRVAVNFEIPLVWCGENSAYEYGGPKEIAESPVMTEKWFNDFAAHGSKSLEEIAKKEGIPEEKTLMYTYPKNLDKTTEAHFMSYYFPWDSTTNLKTAKRYGFISLEEPFEGTFRKYHGIDEKIHRIHQYLKLMKFGYGRATDHACEEIRNGRITKEKAKQLVKKFEYKEISNEFLEDFANFIGWDIKKCSEVIEKFRNMKIWRKTDNGYSLR